jgi:3-hydroxybutyryl-CoA dehydrogenase
VLDACVRGAGFRMGPCELMDLIGHDTNFFVTQSVYEANFQDKRYVPSLIQREMVDGGLLGRKSKRGFYRYPEGAAKTSDGEVETTPLPAVPLVLHGTGATADLLAGRLAAAGLGFTREPAGARVETSLQIGDGRVMLTDGRCAAERAASLGIADLALFDWPVGPAAAGSTTPVAALAWTVAPQACVEFATQAAEVLRALGWLPQRMADVPGLVVARTIAMLVNEASDAVEQGVCDSAGADAAMTLGVNYPAGPFAWLALWGADAVVRLLDALDAQYRGERYRVSPRLRRMTFAAASKESRAAR